MFRTTRINPEQPLNIRSSKGTSGKLVENSHLVILSEIFSDKSLFLWNNVEQPGLRRKDTTCKIPVTNFSFKSFFKKLNVFYKSVEFVVKSNSIVFSCSLSYANTSLQRTKQKRKKKVLECSCTNLLSPILQMFVASVLGDDGVTIRRELEKFE